MLSCGESQTWLFLLQGLDRKLDIGGVATHPLSDWKCAWTLTSVVYVSFLVQRRGGGVTVIDKSCTGKVIYLTHSMKHHCMKTCGGNWRQSPTQLGSKWRRTLSLTLRRISCLRKAPYIPLKGQVWSLNCSNASSRQSYNGWIFPISTVTNKNCTNPLAPPSAFPQFWW